MVPSRVVLLVVLAVSFGAFAQQASKAPAEQGVGNGGSQTGPVPARFVDGLEAAAATIPFPDYRKDIALFINCAAQLDETGAVISHFCLDYSGSADDRFRQLVDRFVGGASFSPAKVNGEPLPVVFYFRVYFGRRGEEYAVGVFPNWGDDAERYGLNYEAPQRYDLQPMSDACSIEGGLARILVGADGRASGEAGLVMSYGVPERYSECESWFADSVAAGRYIPAMLDGEPVPATYVEMTGDTEWLRLKRPKGM
jgi:hypothetical protein